MKDKWAHLGHTLGECWTNDQGLTFIHIPKNASSFIKTCLALDPAWRHSDTFVENPRYMVALRDPLERWISGIAQYHYNNQHSNIDVATMSSSTSVITFDDHTEKQSYFLQMVNLDQTVFFNVDSVRLDLIQFLGYSGISGVGKSNESKGNVREIIKEKYRSFLNYHPEIVARIKDHFAEDYELINRVQFYTGKRNND